MTVRELDRRAAHRLAVIRHAQEVTGNVSKTCCYYGITRQAYYKWLRRYEAGGVALGPGIRTCSVQRPPAGPVRHRRPCSTSPANRLRGAGRETYESRPCGRLSSSPTGARSRRGGVASLAYGFGALSFPA